MTQKKGLFQRLNYAEFLNCSAKSFCLIHAIFSAIGFQKLLIRIADTDTQFIWSRVVRRPPHFFLFHNPRFLLPCIRICDTLFLNTGGGKYRLLFLNSVSPYETEFFNRLNSSEDSQRFFYLSFLPYCLLSGFLPAILVKEFLNCNYIIHFCRAKIK